MALEELVQEYENEREPELDRIIRYFKSNDKAITVSVIQREFSFGWRRANRALRQIKERL